MAIILAQRSEAVARYAAEQRIDLTLLIDERREVARAYGVWHRLAIDAWNIARPALFVLDAAGIVRSIYVAESQGEFPSHEHILSDLPPDPSGPP